MAENQEIKVFFGDNGPFEDDNQWNPPEAQRKRQFQTQEGENNGSRLANSFGFQLVKTGIVTISQRVGAYTGNYIAQNAIDNMATVLGYSGSIAMAVAGNPIPLLMEAVSTGIRMADYQAGVTKGNIQAQILSQLTGTSASNRSRGSGGKI